MRLTLYRMDPAPLESLEVSRSIKRSNVSGCILLTPYMNRCSAPLPLFSADCEAASSGSKRRAPDGGSPAGVADWMIPDGGGECVSDARPWSDRKRLRKGASSPVHSVAKRCMTCFIAFTPGQERCEICETKCSASPVDDETNRDGEWECSSCTYLNLSSHRSCEMCMRRRKDAEGTGVLARLRHIAGPRKSMGAVFNNQLSCADGKEMWMDHSTEISDGLTSSYSVNHVNVHKPMDNDSRKGHIILDSDSSDINHESESVDNFSYTVLSGDSESTEDDVEDVSDIDEDFLPNDSSAHRFAAFSAPLNNSIIVSSSYRDEPALSHVVSVADLNRTPGATAIDFSKFVLGNPGGKPLNLKYEARKISRIKKKEKKVKPKKQAYRGPSFKRKK